MSPKLRRWPPSAPRHLSQRASRVRDCSCPARRFRTRPLLTCGSTDVTQARRRPSWPRMLCAGLHRVAYFSPLALSRGGCTGHASRGRGAGSGCPPGPGRHAAVAAGHRGRKGLPPPLRGGRGWCTPRAAGQCGCRAVGNHRRRCHCCRCHCCRCHCCRNASEQGGCDLRMFLCSCSLRHPRFSTPPTPHSNPTSSAARACTAFLSLPSHVCLSLVRVCLPSVGFDNVRCLVCVPRVCVVPLCVRCLVHMIWCSDVDSRGQARAGSQHHAAVRPGPALPRQLRHSGAARRRDAG